MPTVRVSDDVDLVTRDNQKPDAIYVPLYGPVVGRVFRTPDGIGRYWYDTLEDAVADHVVDDIEVIPYAHEEEERTDYEQRYWRAAADYNDWYERTEVDDDDPCPCGKGHTRAEHTYNPDDE